MLPYIDAKPRKPYLDYSPAADSFWCAACQHDDEECNQRVCRRCGSPRGATKRLKTQADDAEGLAERRWSQR